MQFTAEIQRNIVRNEKKKNQNEAKTTEKMTEINLNRKKSKSKD